MSGSRDIRQRKAELRDRLAALGEAPAPSLRVERGAVDPVARGAADEARRAVAGLALDVGALVARVDRLSERVCSLEAITEDGVCGAVLVNALREEVRLLDRLVRDLRNEVQAEPVVVTHGYRRPGG